MGSGRGAASTMRWTRCCVGISSKKVNFILDADIRSFFTEVSQEWVVRFLEHRIGDKRILRLIQKWLRAGVLEDEVVTIEEKGTGQGSVISPLLANVYLHYVFDLWAERWRRREATGDMIMVRYADDIVVGFQHEADARRFWDAMRERLRAFSLSLHPEKTRLIEFGRFAAQNRERRGFGKPETFKFLGFVFISGKSRRGDFQIRRKSRGDRMMAKLREIKEALRERRHVPVPEVGKWLAQVVAGYFAYHAVPTNSPALSAFRYHVVSYGTGSFAGGARGRTWCGSGWRNWQTNFSQSPVSCIPGQVCGSPSNTRGRSRVREFRSLGSVRGGAQKLASQPGKKRQLRKAIAALQAGVKQWCRRRHGSTRAGANHPRPVEHVAAITASKAGFGSLGDASAQTATAHGRLMLTVLGGWQSSSAT